MTETRTEEITPDHLMDNFRGRSLKSIIIFTVVVHVVGLTVTSYSYLWKLVAGEDSSKMSETERVDIALREATSSLRDIAEKHGLKPQDLGDRLGNKAPKAVESKPDAAKPEPADGKSPAKETPPTESTNGAGAADPAQPSKPKSEMEKQIETKAAGPSVPTLENEKEDLFK